MHSRAHRCGGRGGRTSEAAMRWASGVRRTCCSCDCAHLASSCIPCRRGACKRAGWWLSSEGLYDNDRMVGRQCAESVPIVQAGRSRCSRNKVRQAGACVCAECACLGAPREVVHTGDRGSPWDGHEDEKVRHIDKRAMSWLVWPAIDGFGHLPWHLRVGERWTQSLEDGCANTLSDWARGVCGTRCGLTRGRQLRKKGEHFPWRAGGERRRYDLRGLARPQPPSVTHRTLLALTQSC